MFKKRQGTTKKVNLDADIEQINVVNVNEVIQSKPVDDVEKEIEDEPESERMNNQRQNVNKKIEEENRIEKNRRRAGQRRIQMAKQQERTKQMRKEQKRNRYGLLQKERPTENPLAELYVRRKMEGEGEEENEILQMQKQYMGAGKNKVAEYDVKQIQRKIEKVAGESIKTELALRVNYLKDLLENEHERTEYASKKEIKLMKQDRERIEKQLTSKYKTEGRRFFVDSLKNKSLLM